MTLQDLAGRHVLSGVDREYHTKNSRRTKEPDCLRFTLDDITYAVTEDPEDGYRSSVKDIVVSQHATRTRFPAIDVLCVHMPTNNICKMHLSTTHAGLLAVYDLRNGKLIMLVGTSIEEDDDDDIDYYPCFVASFFPENMHTNAQH